MPGQLPRFAVHLAALRMTAGDPTIAAIARRAGCATGTVSGALRGTTVPSTDMGTRIVEALGGRADDEWEAMLAEARTGRVRPWWRRLLRPPLPLLVVTLLAVVAGAVTLVLVLRDDQASEPQVPAATTRYALYRSVNAGEQVVGPPYVIRPGSDPPPNEYEMVVELGLAPAPQPGAPIPGTLQVHDFFCTGNGRLEPCGGVYRSHYFTTAEFAPPLWPTPARSIGPIARFYAPDPTGTCRAGQVAVHRFERPLPSGSRHFAAGIEAPGAGWQQTENLGCVVR